MSYFTKAGLLLACASYASAQFGGSSSHGGDSGSNPYSSSSGSSSSGDGSSYESFFSHYTIIVTAHAVLATVAFGLLFPIGGIMIRLASFPGLWWVHGLFQIVAFILYAAAFALGVYMATTLDLMHQTHAIIGIVLFVLLLVQPILGFLHHAMFKKHSRRVIWSYAHIWLGRAIITVGIVNGGLGLQLAQKIRLYAPPQSAIIGYSVAAGVIWLIYMASALLGESRRPSNSVKGDIMSPPRHGRDSKGRRGHVRRSHRSRSRKQGSRRREMAQYA